MKHACALSASNLDMETLECISFFNQYFTLLYLSSTPIAKQKLNMEIQADSRSRELGFPLNILPCHDTTEGYVIVNQLSRK